MRTSIIVILATLFGMNLLFFVGNDVKKHFFTQNHADLPDKFNHTPKVHAALDAMRLFHNQRFHAFTGWRADAIDIEHYSIDRNGIRATTNQPAGWSDKIYVFGGSTTWGYGLPDEDTIPSMMQRLTPDRLVINKAEMGYNATQELNSLLMALSRGEIDKGTVVFFDGVNEIYHSCAPGRSDFGHAREDQIRKIISRRPKSGTLDLLDTAFFKATRKAADKIKAKFAPKPPVSSCGASEEHAWQVARRLVTTWQAAHDIVTARGMKFVAILQPNPYSDPSLKPHFHSEEFDQGTKALYPKIAELARGKSWFIDGREWLMGKDLYFDACCHVNEKGNAILARYIVENLPPAAAADLAHLAAD